MIPPSRNFVISQTFNDVNQLLQMSSTIESHFGYDWRLRVGKNDEHLGIVLERITKQEEKPPITVSCSFYSKLNNSELNVPNQLITFFEPFELGNQKMIDWKDVIETIISKGELTVSVHIEVIEIFKVSNMFRQCTLTPSIETDLVNNNVNATVEHLGVEWEIVLEHEHDRLFAVLSLKTEKTSANWVINMKSIVKIATKDGKWLEVIAAATFNKNTMSKSLPSFFEWNEVTEKCMIDGKATVEVIIEVWNIRGIGQKRKAEFGLEDEWYSDICIKVGDRDFMANKGILARFSPVLRKKFFGGSAGANLKEFTIQGVDADDFKTFLSLIYVYKPEINSENVRSLLDLSQRYEVEEVTEKCVKFLTTSKYLHVKIKLELAKEFNLENVWNNIMDPLTTMEELKELADKMQPMSDAMSKDFLDKAFSFYP